MLNIKWQEKFSVDIPSIDEQHKKLIEVTNRYYGSLAEQQKDPAFMLSILKELSDYAKKHFAYEENLLRTHHCPGLEKHLEEHQTFLAKIHEIEERLSEERMVLPLELSNFLMNWISTHVQSTDMKYSSLLLSKGVK